MYRFGNRTPRGAVKRLVHDIIRNFPDKGQVIIKRQVEEYDRLGDRKFKYVPVYSGEAMFRPGSGTANAYGLGTVENLSLVGVINSVIDVRQADIVTINDGREYEVQYPPHFFNAITVLQLTQRSQVSQPVQ